MLVLHDESHKSESRSEKSLRCLMLAVMADNPSNCWLNCIQVTTTTTHGFQLFATDLQVTQMVIYQHHTVTCN